METYFNLNGLNIFVRILGKGEPIIFLHGGPGGTQEFFLPHVNPLAQDFRLVLYDQIGCGKSDKDKEDNYSIDSEVENLESLRKALGVEKLNLFGESWGSILALSYAAKYPTKINKIILTAAIGLTKEGYKTFQKEVLKKLGFTGKIKLGMYSMLNGIKSTVRLSNKISELLDPYYVHSLETLKTKKKIFINTVVNKKVAKNIINSYDLIPHIKNIQDIPILVAQGTDDILPPRLIERLLVNHLSKTELVEIQCSGHWTILEQPERMVSITKQFLKKDKGQ